MNVRKYINSVRDDETAVSPVIGVILMVAITVILAAVIGSFVLGLGKSATSGTAPQVKFSFDYESTSNGGAVTVTHSSGDPIKAAQLSIKEAEGANDSNGKAPENVKASTLAGDSEVTAGDSATINKLDKGDTIKLVWASENGKSTDIVASYTVPR